MSGKGSRQRPVIDRDKFSEEFDRIFKKKEVKPRKKPPKEVTHQTMKHKDKKKEAKKKGHE